MGRLDDRVKAIQQALAWNAKWEAGEITDEEYKARIPEFEAAIKKANSGGGFLSLSIDTPEFIEAFDPTSSASLEDRARDIVDDTVQVNTSGLVDTHGGGAVGEAAGEAFDEADKVGGQVVEVLSGEKAADAEQDAIDEANDIAEQTKIEQQEIIAETKEEIVEKNKDLLEYADAKGLEIEEILLNSTDETARILIQSLRDAKDQEDAGLVDASNEILQGLDTAQQHLLKGEQEAADAAIAAIGEASARFQSTQDESRELFAPWIENGKWATNELKDRANELTRKFTLDDFTVDPGRQARLESGQKAIINYGSSIGITGNTAKDLVEYSQEFSSQEFQNAYIRFRDFQNNATNYLTNISNQGKDATTQYSEILANTNANLASLDLEKGNTLSNFLRNKGIIKSGYAEREAGVRSGVILDRANLSARLTGDTAAVQAGQTADTGTIRANTLQNQVNDRKTITGSENTLAAGLAGANINVTGDYGQRAGNLAIASGQVAANQSNRQANLINNTLSNYLFFKYSGVGSGGGAGGGAGTTPANGSTSTQFV